MSFDEKELRTQECGVQLNRHFENRLFDRDTLLLCHYDVNFLYIVSLYGRDNKSAQSTWREYVRKEFRTRIQDTLNGLYTFRTLHPRYGMDCYQFIKDNFHQLNGKLYRPKTNSNYLILALMNDDKNGMWKSLNIKSDVVEREALCNKDLLRSLRTHFHVSEPFLLEPEFNVGEMPNVGTLDKPSLLQTKNILTGLVRKSDKDVDAFTNHEATSYVMEKIPMSINFMDVEYFLPMVDGDIDGYYKVEKVYFGKKDGEMCLKLNLPAYISLGERRVKIYRIKMQPGELISFDLMRELYGE